MPIYEFRCSSCGHRFEELIFRKKEIEELTCPECGHEEVTQELSTFSSSAKSSSPGASRSCGPGSFS
jgi:putative FmdB family regulatory protein